MAAWRRREAIGGRRSVRTLPWPSFSTRRRGQLAQAGCNPPVAILLPLNRRPAAPSRFRTWLHGPCPPAFRACKPAQSRCKLQLLLLLSPPPIALRLRETSFVHGLHLTLHLCCVSFPPLHSFTPAPQRLARQCPRPACATTAAPRRSRQAPLPPLSTTKQFAEHGIAPTSPRLATTGVYFLASCHCCIASFAAWLHAVRRRRLSYCVDSRPRQAPSLAFCLNDTTNIHI